MSEIEYNPTACQCHHKMAFRHHLYYSNIKFNNFQRDRGKRGKKIQLKEALRVGSLLLKGEFI